MKDFGEGSSTVKRAPEECEQMTLCWNAEVDLTDCLAWQNGILKAYSPERRQAAGTHPATWHRSTRVERGGRGRRKGNIEQFTCAT